MNWSEILIILVPLGAFLAFIWKEISQWRQETRDETSSIRAEVAEIRKGFREELNQQALRTDQQMDRTNHLYEMFIDLLKSQQGKTNP